MAEVAISNGDVAGKGGLVKPEKPDEEVYKKELAKAEKDHADSMTRFVCQNILNWRFCAYNCGLRLLAENYADFHALPECNQGQARPGQAKLQGLPKQQAPQRTPD